MIGILQKRAHIVPFHLFEALEHTILIYDGKKLKTTVASGDGVGMRIDWEGAEGTFWLMALYFDIGFGLHKSMHLSKLIKWYT